MLDHHTFDLLKCDWYLILFNLFVIFHRCTDKKWRVNRVIRILLYTLKGQKRKNLLTLSFDSISPWSGWESWIWRLVTKIIFIKILKFFIFFSSKYFNYDWFKRWMKLVPKILIYLSSNLALAVAVTLLFYFIFILFA